MNRFWILASWVLCVPMTWAGQEDIPARLKLPISPLGEFPIPFRPWVSLADHAPASLASPAPASERGTALPQLPYRRPAKDPLQVGERLEFEITYFGVPAGTFTLETLPFQWINGRKVYHVRGTARSTGVFRLFYRLDDTIESFLDYDSLVSLRFQCELNETKQLKKSVEINDPVQAKTYFWNRWKPSDNPFREVQKEAVIPALIQDSLSALFFTRMQEFTEASPVSTFSIASESNNWDAVITHVRGDRLKVANLGEVNAKVFKMEAKYQGILKRSGDSFLWLSDDDRRIVLRLEAHVKIGTVVATLRKIERTI